MGRSKNIRVLLIEDNSFDACVIQEMLAKAKGASFDLECVDLLSTGLERLAKGGIDLVLLDLSLPECQGIDAFRKLCSRAPQAPVVVMTDPAGEVTAIKAVREGAQDYFIKGQVAGYRLVRSILYAIERKQVKQELQEAYDKAMQYEIAKRMRIEEESKQSIKKLRTIMEGTINAMALMSEARDPYTAGHQRRVSALSVTIASEMGLPETMIEGIRIAGILHDVGKISVPSEILSKPTKLTDVEFRLIKLHPQSAYDILKEAELPFPIAEIVLQHHERMDGSGYPQGLSGEDILAEAKILGVADVVEAMASHRPYRPALGTDKALEEISKNRGVLYDAEVVDACLRVLARKGLS